MTRVMCHTAPTAAAIGIRDTGDDWRTRAACLAVDPELFWPTGDTSFDDRMQIAEAKAV